jgi:hypothetical protein
MLLLAWQDLPEEAFLTPEVAVQAVKDGATAALSYRWLTREHPDPNGFHLVALRKALSSRLLVGPRVTKGESSTIKALFMDFLSCPQKDSQGQRTASEKDVFDSCLDVMGSLYASPRTLVVQHKRLPAGFDPTSPTYDQSGWCNFEQAVAWLCHKSKSVKVCQRCPELILLAFQNLAMTGSFLEPILILAILILQVIEIGLNDTPSLDSARLSSSLPDVTSLEDMNDLFFNEARTTFVGKADREKVARMFREFSKKVVDLEYTTLPYCIKCAEETAVDGLSWGKCCMVSSMAVVFTIASALVNPTSILNFGRPAAPIINFCLFVASATVFAFMYIPLSSPTYRARWYSCLARFLCCKGLGNGPDPADLRRAVVYPKEKNKKLAVKHTKVLPAPATSCA